MFAPSQNSRAIHGLRQVSMPVIAGILHRRRLWHECGAQSFPWVKAMSSLPLAHLAQLDIGKLRDYALSETHIYGRHKARVFRSALGVSAADSEWLGQEILLAIQTAEARELPATPFGRRYRVDLEVSRQDRRAVVRTVWMIESNSQVPRLLTCWIL
jgi:hypothetical protein